MRSEDCVIVWGAGEPGDVETDVVGPAGSTELAPCTKLREGVGWTTDVVVAEASAEPSLTVVGTAKYQGYGRVGTPVFHNWIRAYRTSDSVPHSRKEFRRFSWRSVANRGIASSYHNIMTVHDLRPQRIRGDTRRLNPSHCEESPQT